MKPWEDNKASASSAGTDAGTATSNATTNRRPPSPRASRSPKTESGEAGTISRPHAGQNSRAQLAKRSLKRSFSSVIVPTVERELRMELVWRIAIAGGMPSTASTAGGGSRSRNWRA